MARRYLTVRRKGHKRKSYMKDVKRGKGVKMKRIPATRVKPSKPFKIRDVGTVGRGRKIIKIKRKGALRRLGYSIKKSASARRRILNKAVKRYGKANVWRMLNAQVRFREMGGVAGEVFRPEVRATGKRFQADRNYITRKYGGIVPRKAIAKWKAMPPAVRSRKIRMAKGLPPKAYATLNRVI